MGCVRPSRQKKVGASSQVTKVLCATAMATACGGATSTPSTDGGSGSGGGSGADGSVSCALGTVTFHLSAASGMSSDWCVGLHCTSEWVTVTGALSSRPFPLSQGCTAECGACQPIGCPALCLAPQTMMPDGERLTWDGTFWEDRTCGSSQLACRAKTCALPGRYVAEMCAAPARPMQGPAGFCNAALDAERCVQVPFDFPGTPVVEGILQ
jgi:hypothetical protein